MVAAAALEGPSRSPSKSLSRIQQKARGKQLKLAMPPNAQSPRFTPESAPLTASEVLPYNYTDHPN